MLPKVKILLLEIINVVKGKDPALRENANVVKGKDPTARESANVVKGKDPVSIIFRTKDIHSWKTCFSAYACFEDSLPRKP